MSHARDKLYNGYLRRNMPKIVSSVKVKEIIPHLPCLTDHDRENIEAKRETYGNYDGMMLLLDCLKRRESWPEQFIQALQACEHPTIAAEIKAEYDTLRGASNSTPGSPPTTVVRAHVHPAPSVSHPPVPESGGNSQAAVASPAEASAPPGPAAQPSPPVEIPVQPQDPQSSTAPVPEDVPPPEPVADPPKAAQIEVAPPPSTPPPSPETPHIQRSASPPPNTEIISHQEPEENSESDIQDNAVSAGNEMVQVDSVETPEPPCPVEQSESDTPATTTEVTPPRSPSPKEKDSDVADGAPVSVTTPEKPPIQDTAPPSAATLEPEETSEAVTEQAVESIPEAEAAAPNSPTPAAAIAAAAVPDTPLCADSSVCLSKPGELISVHPQNHDSPTIRAPSPPAEPYSGDSGRLQISTAEEDAVTSSYTPACSAVSSSTEKSVSALPCQENGIDTTHNEPEENHYESPAPSLEVQEHVVHVSGEPSILDLAVQDPAPQAQIVNGEASKEMKPVSPGSTDPTETVSPSKENCHPSEPAPEEVSPQPQTLKDSEERTASRALPVNTKYIVAAGVGACALLMAWKFKK
ncbi:mitochondrial antiviral-signaling protein isoform X2 [Halichoeres trimaculatus]|uniref:mitochondrial antiviral-signaling protein isoform X2 n=1 Tax=Halichoeres trimaculatus TaxID=147232 RepID=UPI003D9DCCE4